MNLQSESVKEIANALAAAQAEMPIVKKGSTNPFFKAKYADLAAIWHAAKDVLSKHGLSVSQGSTLLEGRLCIVTTLLHTSGEWIRGIMPVYSKDENDPQKWGSGITYARRYALAGILSMVAEDEDDDGNAASRGGKQKPPEQKQDNQADSYMIMQTYLLEMDKIDNLKHLENWWKKYSPEFTALKDEHKQKLTNKKDNMKADFKLALEEQ